jgi:hypothetical protein
MASELRVNTLKDAAGNNSIATSFVAGGSAKAWVNFNGQGTIASRSSLNVTSLADNGTGDYTISISSSFSDANYTLGTYCAATPTSANFNNRIFGSSEKAAGSHRQAAGYVSSTVGGIAAYDNEINDIIFMGDLA